NPVIGLNYYRLRIVDIDNSAKYSLIKSVKNSLLRNFTIYPNPVKNKLLVNIEAGTTDKAEISITDIDGRNVYRSSLNLFQGANTIPVNISNLAQGSYFMKIQMTDGSFIKKFSKQ
ncbi:MAG: T9SS type A sorting domain-containing protein, partial [Ginsengibacter sp.]